MYCYRMESLVDAGKKCSSMPNLYEARRGSQSLVRYRSDIITKDARFATDRNRFLAHSEPLLSLSQVSNSVKLLERLRIISGEIEKQKAHDYEISNSGECFVRNIVRGPRGYGKEPSQTGLSNDVRRRIRLTGADLKRLLDREDAAMANALFSKQTPSYLPMLFKVSKLLSEIDFTLQIVQMFLQLLSKSDMGFKHAATFVKAGGNTYLLSSIQFYYKFLTKEEQETSIPMTSRFEELCQTSFKLLMITAKSDRKLPLMTRVNETLGAAILVLTWALERGDIGRTIAVSEFIQLCIKNENNIATFWKCGLCPSICNIIRANIRDLPARSFVILNLMASMALKWPDEIRQRLPFQMLLTALTHLPTSGSSTTQKAILKIMKAFLVSPEGRKAFAEIGGVSVLRNLFQKVIKEDVDINSSVSPNSLPNLVMTILRCTLPDVQLPFLGRFTARKFDMRPVVAENDVEDYRSEQLPYNFSSNVRSLFPELELNVLNQTATRPSVLNSTTIEVAHVQPINSNLSEVDMSRSFDEVEKMSSQTKAAARKAVVDELKRLMSSEKVDNAEKQLVYDVMDDSVERQFTDVTHTLMFDSRFESGNLQMAIKVADREYDLLVQSDINTIPGTHNQWFFFKVAGMVPNEPYKFNIINLTKAHSQFNFGMQPVVYSTIERVWKRAGVDVSYFKNHYQRNSIGDNSSSDNYSTLSFTIMFNHPNDPCYIAYHYPYTSAYLRRFVYGLQFSNTDKLIRQDLCKSLAGNTLDLLTITNFQPTAEIPIDNRHYIYLTARVHPGESNASHIMHGIIEFLLSSHASAIQLRDQCVFKIIPMLNPDGVINGHYRTSLDGRDLNRRWKDPDPKREPEIWHAKNLLAEMCARGKKPTIFVDIHGHSRKKNAFLYACEYDDSSSTIEKFLPCFMSNSCDAFSLSSCKYTVEKSKETTARVVAWKEFDIACTYTLECSFAGGDSGEFKRVHFNIPTLHLIGQKLCESILQVLPLMKSAPGAFESALCTPRKREPLRRNLSGSEDLNDDEKSAEEEDDG